MLYCISVFYIFYVGALFSLRIIPRQRDDNKKKNVEYTKRQYSFLNKPLVTIGLTALLLPRFVEASALTKTEEKNGDVTPCTLLLFT